MGLGHWEILAIVVAVLLLFGGKKIPELMRGIGSGMRQFKQGLHGEEDETKPVAREEKKESSES